MLFIDSYNAKSLDRSSVSMIDKFNSRLDAVNDLINELMSLVDDLLELITSIRYTLGTAKSRVYSNLEQMEEVIEGNGITGTESTIQAIEDALEAGDDAMSKAEANLEDIKAAADCDQTIKEAEQESSDNSNDCGEDPEPNSEEFDEDDCDYCSYSETLISDEEEFVLTIEECNVCAHSDCNVNISCDEPWTSDSDAVKGASNNCVYSYEKDADCEQVTKTENGQTVCAQPENTDAPDNCNFICDHSSECGEMPMPENCTYTCIDGEGCNYSDDDCTYSTVCGQEEACNQIDCEQYDCGEPCGETCHMTDDCSESDDCAESCGEDDCSYGCDDEGTGTEQGCAEGSCGEGSCGM